MKRNHQSGVALLSAILVLMLMSALLVGFIAMVSADQTASGINRDQTQAYAAAHAGVEKLTADLGQLFSANFAPTGAQIATLTTPAMEPTLPGIQFQAPNAMPGYTIRFTDNDADGNPDVENPNGSQIAAGPYQGLVGLITPYEIEVTARTVGNAEVRMRRTMQTIGIPVFQFGIFSENDQSFFAGPNFAFGGRVHTNQNLFLKQDGANTLTLQDRVTAVGEVIRTHLANGVTGTHASPNVRVARAAGCPAAPTPINASCRNLAATEGSLVNTLGSAQNEPTWTNISMGTYNGWIRNGRTGARRLDLPIVSDGATPADLIRRPPVGEVVTSAIGRQRFYNMATLRILLSDTAADIQNLPSVVALPLALNNVAEPAGFNPVTHGFGGMAGAIPPTRFAESAGDQANGDRTTAGTSRLDGFLSVEMQQRDGAWVDVTREILSLGFAGRRLSNGALNTLDETNGCTDPHPNAVIRLQRTRDNLGGGFPGCGGLSATASDYWPNVFYDPREGAKRDNVPTNQTLLWWSGVMHYVELDVNNLRRWLRSDIGTAGRNACINGAGPASCPMDVTGFVVHFSDRRTNRNAGNLETGEFGWEDNINTDANSTPNNALDHPFVDAQGVNRWSEDVNLNGALESYGNIARTLPAWVAGPLNPNLQLPPVVGSVTPVGNVYDLWNTTIDANVARRNRAFFFRRALKLINGGRGMLPANGTQGLTVASENPVYIQGNYNACTNHLPVGSPLGPGLGGLPTLAGNSFNPACAGGVGFGATPGNDHVSAAVIADAVTLLSNAWNDIRSFVVPHGAGVNMGGANTVAANRATRLAATTWYRLGIIAGKPLNFPRASVAPTGADHTDFGTDGGAHNFLRYIENWGTWNNGVVNGSTLNYRGSILSFYTSRQAVGTYKCCDNVYSPPSRGYNFDAEFLNPNLLPPRTPMFRDLNTLTFRQILRPTQ